jgi:hypothetical protein
MLDGRFRDGSDCNYSILTVSTLSPPRSDSCLDIISEESRLIPYPEALSSIKASEISTRIIRIPMSR